MATQLLTDIEHDEIVFSSEGMPRRVIYSDREHDEWFLTEYNSYEKKEIAATQIMTKRDLLAYLNTRGFFS